MNLMARRLILALAVIGHLGAGFFYLLTGLAAPMWAAVVMWVLWFLLLWVLVGLWRQRPVMALLVPPLALGTWFVAMNAGGRFLGWVA